MNLIRAFSLINFHCALNLGKLKSLYGRRFLERVNFGFRKADKQREVGKKNKANLRVENERIRCSASNVNHFRRLKVSY